VTPVRVLFLSANPSTTVRLAIDEELHAIATRLRSAGVADRFELRSEGAVRPDELPAALLRHQPRIVHFSGHGSKSGELLLAGDPSEVAPVSAEALRNLFRILSPGILCVVLNACYSEAQAAALASVLPCAVGMQKTVNDRAAIAFVAGFYEALAFGKSFKTAFELGRAATLLADRAGFGEAPQLVAGAGVDLEQLFLIGAPKTAPASMPSQRPGIAAKQPAPTRPSMRKLLAAVLPLAEDLDNFCVDYFPAVHRRFGTGMGRLERESLLISLITTPVLLAKLREHDEEAVSQNESVLKYD
jgi:hypothetical protein